MPSCGPRTHRSVTLLSYGILGVLRSAIFAGRGVSRFSGTVSPAFNRRPPNPPRANFSPVETLPITDGISKPPDTARYALMPFTEPDDIKYEPSGRKYALFISARFPFINGTISAPETAITVSHINCTHIPASVISRTPQQGSLPQRIFAIFMDSLSAQPETMNPSD